MRRRSRAERLIRVSNSSRPISTTPTATDRRSGPNQMLPTEGRLTADGGRLAPLALQQRDDWTVAAPHLPGQSGGNHHRPNDCGQPAGPAREERRTRDATASGMPADVLATAVRCVALPLDGSRSANACAGSLIGGSRPIAALRHRGHPPTVRLHRRRMWNEDRDVDQRAPAGRMPDCDH